MDEIILLEEKMQITGDNINFVGMEILIFSRAQEYEEVIYNLVN